MSDIANLISSVLSEILNAFTASVGTIMATVFPFSVMMGLTTFIIYTFRDTIANIMDLMLPR